MSRPKMYLAGPEVFLPEPLVAVRRKKELCRKYGFEGVFSLDIELQLDALPKRARGIRISQANETLIRESDGLVANITPFRGPSMDTGTAFELGFARALGKPIFGYTNDPRTYQERVMTACGKSGHYQEDQEGRLEDRQGLAIEDFDLADNLMIDGALYSATGYPVVVLNRLKSETYTDLEGFEACLRLAREFYF